MENVHHAIAWYQTKIGSYDKQLWEQSVERKLQKQPPFVLHNAPRKKVRHKTEYIDVDLIRGSTFTKTKPQVPWVYITRKAVARVLFFPFYYKWWVHQTSKKLYALLLVLYILQVVTVIVYLKNFDHSIMEDELCFTEVTLPTILMFLLCLIHSQTVLAHINHKPPKRNKNISGVTRKPRPKKTSRKGRSSGNNSTCPEDGGNTDTSRSSRRQTPNQPAASDTILESNSLNAVSDAIPKKNMDPPISASIDMEKNLLSRSVSDYDLKPAVSSTLSEPVQSRCSTLHRQRPVIKNTVVSNWHQDRDSSIRKQNDHHDKGNEYCVNNKLEDVKKNSSVKVHKSGCNYNLLNNLSSPLTVEKVHSDANVLVDKDDKDNLEKLNNSSDIKLKHANLMSEEKFNNSETTASQCYLQANSENNRKTLARRISQECVDINKTDDHIEITNNIDIKNEDSMGFTASQTGIRTGSSSYGVLPKNCILQETEAYEDDRLGLGHPSMECSGASDTDEDTSIVQSARSKYHGVHEASIECPSGSDNLSVSDFEMVDHHVAEKNSSDQSATTIDLAACSCIQMGRKNFQPYNTTEAKIENETTQQAVNIMVRFKPKPFKSQDSSDSGINNEVPYTDCNCVNLQKDNTCDCTPTNKWQTSSSSGVEDIDDASLTSNARCHLSESQHQTQFLSDCNAEALLLKPNFTTDSSVSQSDSYNPPTVKDNYLPDNYVSLSSQLKENNNKIDHQSEHATVSEMKNQPQISCNLSNLQNDNPTSAKKTDSQTSITHNPASPEESSSQLHCFSELFVQEILNEDTLREMSCSSLLAHSDLENSSSSVSRLSTASTTSSTSNSSSCCKIYNTHHIPPSTKNLPAQIEEPSEHRHHHHHHHHNHHQSLQKQENISHRHGNHERVKIEDDDEKNDPLDESLEHINASDGERPSDDVSNYNPSDSDAESDGPVNEDVCNRYEEKWKRLRFQELTVGSDTGGNIITSKANTNIASNPALAKVGSGISINGGASRSVVGILTRKPSPLKDLAISRKSNSIMPVTNSSGSDQNINETRNQLRRRRRTSGTPSETVESNRIRNVPTTLGLLPSDTKGTHISSSENETGGARTPEGSNKATMSSEEWEDRIQSDETTSSAYSSNTDLDSEEKVEEEERTEYTTSTLHVINLLQPQVGSPSSSGNITQPDRVSCVIWEGSDCKKVDLTALDIGWAIIDKVDSLPESSDYFLIGLSFSFIICVMPLVFRAYASKDAANLEDFLSWSGLMTKLIELQTIIKNAYSWRQYLLMVNGILQRFFLSLIFFFLLSVADRTFKQRLLYAKHFSYLTSSRRARKFSMPHFRLNKVRNIKIWLSLRSYLKRRGPQRSVDVIVSACFLCAVCTVCLISLQMLKDTDSYLDYLCNWELLVWCTALGVFLMRFMTVGLKINKKYRNLSVLITEQINLYLQMEQKPHKKEELILANNVLRLAEDLLKELESPFKISGFSANPLIYNIMRVVVLSAFSAVLTEVLGFKLKLHKIKLKA